MNLDVSKLVGLITKVLPYAKALAATLGAVVTTLICALDGTIDPQDATLIGTAWVTAWGVWRVTNKVG